jgi:hypothetical protein
MALQRNHPYEEEINLLQQKIALMEERYYTTLINEKDFERLHQLRTQIDELRINLTELETRSAASSDKEAV